MKRLFLGLASIFFIYALFGAIGSGKITWSVVIFPIFIFIFLIVLFNVFFLPMFEIKGMSSENLIITLAKKILFSLIVFFIIFVSIAFRNNILNFLVKTWSNLPPIAQISPFISTLSSVVSLILTYLSYRRENHKEQREINEYLVRKTKLDSKIIIPTSDDISKYAKK